MPLVAVILGSKTDEAFAAETSAVLDQMGVEHELQVISAHRSPEKLRRYVQEAPAKGIEVFIGLAGGAAALPGAIASWTTLPVIGVPLPTSELGGVDALQAIVQMPPGVPVATVAVGSWGARNAAFLAAQIVGAKHPAVAQAYAQHREGLR